MRIRAAVRRLAPAAPLLAALLTVQTATPGEPQDSVYAITDVMVTDNAQGVPGDYTGVSPDGVTLPYIPGQVGERVNGADVNRGIGGTNTSIWVRYQRLPKDSGMPVLVDIEVRHWVKWKVSLPEGPGWKTASGTSAGIQGALTTKTKGSVWRNGLAVRYMPLKDASTRTMALYLNVGKSNALPAPPITEVAGSPVTMNRAGIDIHTGGGGAFYRLMSFSLPSGPPSAPDFQTVKRFSPVLKFDKAHKGLPLSAQVYFATVMKPSKNTWTTPWDGPCGEPGVMKIRGRDEANCGLESNDFQTLRAGKVPTYYRAIANYDGRLRIVYWWFYGFQQHCNPMPFGALHGAAGEHHGDWERIMVTTSLDRSEIAAVTYYLHGDWYTRRRGHFETEQGRPVVYVGKLAHASYHNRDHSGFGVGSPFQCCEYADYRDPSPQSVWMNTNENLVDLDGAAEPWMRADRIGSTYERKGSKFTIAEWTWGPHISHNLRGKWRHEPACSTHPTIEALDWSIASCDGVGCGGIKAECPYPETPNFDEGWP